MEVYNKIELFMIDSINSYWFKTFWREPSIRKELGRCLENNSENFFEKTYIQGINKRYNLIKIGVPYRADKGGHLYDKEFILNLNNYPKWRENIIYVPVSICAPKDLDTVLLSERYEYNPTTIIQKLHGMIITGSAFNSRTDVPNVGNVYKVFENINQKTPKSNKISFLKFKNSIANIKEKTYADIINALKRCLPSDIYNKIYRDVYKICEENSRSPFEMKLIREAINQSVPIFAICAGSWRVWESFGGSVKTFDTKNKKLHKSEADPWELRHSLQGRDGSDVISQINSTHSARCIGNPTDHGIEANLFSKKEIEGFESKDGASYIKGVQFHPESNIIGGLSYSKITDEEKAFSEDQIRPFVEEVQLRYAKLLSNGILKV